MSTKYDEIKNIFLDIVDKRAYVELDSATYNYSVLKNSFSERMGASK